MFSWLTMMQETAERVYYLRAVQLLGNPTLNAAIVSLTKTSQRVEGLDGLRGRLEAL